jgi:23S rRNA (guanine745-N1)-methyltransferase
MSALVDVLPNLRCTICGDGLTLEDRQVRCGNAHTFDIARQGYLNLAVGSAAGGTGDSAAMVHARADFLTGGFYRPIADAIVGATTDVTDTRLVVDLGGGTGYYLALVLDAVPAAHGVCLDRSTAALRQAARAHPNGAAVGCDVWRGIPLIDASADVVLDVFAPRNADEIRRVLSPTGRLIVVTPTARHLTEIIEPLGMLSVDEHKTSRLEAGLTGFTPLSTRTVEYELELDRRSTRDLVLMGPAAWHASAEEIEQRVGELHRPIRVTASVDITVVRVDS